MLLCRLKFVEEPSLVPLLGLREGRFSFLGMNPEVEKLMANEEQAKRDAEELRLQEGREKSVTDLQMAEHYGTLVHSLGNKFKTKKERIGEQSKRNQVDEDSMPCPTKKPRFIKPEVDDYE
jgi:M-phase phosphoprotein-6